MNAKLPRIGVSEVVRALKRAGFEERRQKGSHLHLRRASDKRRVTVPVHKGKDMPVGTLRGILNDADLRIEEFRKLL